MIEALCGPVGPAGPRAARTIRTWPLPGTVAGDFSGIRCVSLSAARVSREL